MTGASLPSTPMVAAGQPDERLHILILTDRDWTHPQGGGTGTNLFGQVARWLAWGHRVTVIACSYPGAQRLERIDNLTIHRMGGRSTVFPRVIWKQWRGLVPDADVVLEVVNGVTFLTPIWLRTPRVTLIHHIHRGHYVEELGRAGKVAAFLLETAPLRLLYGDSHFLTLSNGTAAEIAEHGIPFEDIEVNYIGVEQEAFAPGERAPEPTLLYLGRLKRYKRIETVLDVLEAVPGATLDIAGDGDHREELEAEIERRGLRERVRMHGFVDEDQKLELLQRSWVNLTASSAEGWCLTVMEAAACATPSAALAVGGLPESISDGETGLLAKDTDELAARTRELVGQPELRDRLGRQALERAHEFTWDRTAQRTLDLLKSERERAGERRPLLKRFGQSDTGRAAGLAGAVIAGNIIALAFTIVFARVLGASGYGSLAALISAFIILMVPGSALQIATAREVSRDLATDPQHAGTGVRRWLQRLLLVVAGTVVAGVLLRNLIADALNVDAVWAAAAVPLTAAMWMILSVERGALQGFQRYRTVGLSIIGEAGTRLLFGLLLVGLDLGVTGAFLGTPLSLAAMAAVLAIPLHKRLPPVDSALAAQRRLRDLLGNAWVPVIALTLVFALQEVHLIVVKHEVSGDAAGAYAVAFVAAKAIIWVAIGLGLYLLPEAARRARLGVDARPILARTLALIAFCALPMVALYAVAAKPILAAVFGADKTGAAGALPWLGLAMALLACAYLSVQYLLALGQSRFIGVLGGAAVLEVLVLLGIGSNLTEVALALCGLQLLVAVSVLVISMRVEPTVGRPGSTVLV